MKRSLLLCKPFNHSSQPCPTNRFYLERSASMDKLNTGDTALVLISAALVALMTPGLAFFYGGLVRRKNVLAIMMQSFISMGVVTIIWVLVGFSLAFGKDTW